MVQEFQFIGVFGAIVVIIPFATLLIAWLLGRNSLIAPIQNLLEMTHQFAEGNLTKRSDLKEQPDEFSTLTKAFHDMADALSISQTAILENEARFRIVMDSLDALVYVADMESYEVLFINQKMKNLTGDIVGQTCWQKLQVGQTGPCPFCTNKYLLDQAGQPGDIYTWEFQNTLTGAWYFIHDRAIKWVDGRIVRLEIATDITDRKEAELKLAQETERLAVTLRSIGDGVIATDTEGRVILLNQVAEALTGWHNGEAIDRQLHEVFQLIDEKTGQPFALPVQNISAEQSIDQSDQLSLIDKQGLKRRISASGGAIKNLDNNIIGAVLVFKDITELLRTEEELTKVRKLESIGVLAGGIAHDFNNILASILGNIDLSLRDSELNEKTKRRLKYAQTASFRARDLTQQLLTFAKGGQPIKQTASLAEVVQESAGFVLRGDKVACQYDFPDDLWRVDIDKGQISQVVQNLVINSSSAMPDGGRIEIAAKNVVRPSQLPTAESCIQLDIKDSGSGIPAEALDKIFDPYFTTKQQGSGLGLAITHSIISKHGGSISVHSTPDVGTTFSIYLPASKQSATSAMEADDDTLQTGRAKILVMDDEEIIRDILREMLSEMGHEVVFAEDGLEAIQIYQEAMPGAPFDLTIMDLTIPGGVGGKDAIAQLLTIDSTARAIVSSGYSNDPIMANFSDYGFCAAIAKPYQMSELAKTINQLLG